MKRRQLCTQIIVAAMFLIVCTVKCVWAANYYVRTDGNDSNCSGLADAADPGSGSTPRACAFRTVQTGVNRATVPGDFVNIRGDHTSEGLLYSKADGCTGTGCTGNPTYITIQTTPGAAQYSAIISPGIQLNHNYIIVNGLGIVGSYGYSSGYAGVSFGWSNPALYCKAINNHIYNPRESVASGAVVFGATSHYNVFEGNLVEGDTSPAHVAGHHTGANSTTLTDSYYAWTPNQWQGRRIWNFTATANSWAGTDAGTVLSNDAHSITTTSNITWNTNDCYGVGSSFWIPFVVDGTDNTIRNNIIRNLMNTERVFDGMADNTVISGNEVANLLDGNDLAGSSRPAFDNCGAHTDIFQVWDHESISVLIENNYFHDIQAQTGMLEGNGKTISDWIIRNNVFANITHRNTVGGPGFKRFNNTYFNVAQSDQVYPLENWSPGEEYKNNIIIGGSANPDYGVIGSLIGNWTECAKNVITQTWAANTALSHWIGQGGTQAILTAGGRVYIGTGSGNTGSSQPNWNNCSTVNTTCTDNGITWTNTAWNTTCTVTGTKDVLFGDQWGLNRRNGVTSSFTCNASAVDGGDPRLYDAEGIKTCLSKDSSDSAASNNYYGIWNPPTYSPRTKSIIDIWIGDRNYINGGNPKFVAPYTDCLNNACDFHLQADSPLIGKGMALAGVTKDKDGVLRPNPPAIGAYEYSQGGPALLYGDVSENGSVTAYDASLAAQYGVGSITLTSSQVVKADVSGNGSVTSFDASLIAQYAVGLITKFPVQG